MIALCDRFKCLPSQILKEDASILRLLRIYDLGTPDDKKGGGQEWPT